MAFADGWVMGMVCLLFPLCGGSIEDGEGRKWSRWQKTCEIGQG